MLAGTDPAAMAAHLGGAASQRKLRLLLAACCRRVPRGLDWLLDDAERHADGAAEEHAPGLAFDRACGLSDMADGTDPVEDALACAAAFVCDPALEAGDAMGCLENLAEAVAERAEEEGADADADLEEERAAWAKLARCTFGKPFRLATVTLDWITSDVLALAEAACTHRVQADSQQDPPRIGVLADALEETGGSGDVLAHLRGPGPHARGCWGVDALAGRS